MAGSAASKVDLPSSSFSTLTAVWLTYILWTNISRKIRPCLIFQNCSDSMKIWGDLPFKEEPGSETVDRNGKESLGLRRVDVHSDHLSESESESKSESEGQSKSES